MKKNHYKVLLFLIISVLSNNIYSQDSKWNGSLNIGGNFFKGNVNKSDYNFSGELFHKDTLFEYTTNASVLYSFADKTLKNKELQFSQTFDWKPHHKLSPFMALTAYSDVFKGYNLKLGGFSGIKYTFIDTKSGKYSISAAISYEHEIYAPDTAGFSNPEKNLLRLSIRPKFHQKIGIVTLENITFYKPDIQDFYDYLIDSQTKFNIDITERFAFGVKYEFHFNSKPPYENILKEDQMLLFSIILKLTHTIHKIF